MLTEGRNTPSSGLPVGVGHEDAALSEPVDLSVEQTPEQRVGRAAVVGAVIGLAVMIPMFFVVGIITGAGAGGAVVLALFCGFLGGVGLGGMEGAVAGFAKEERREAKASRRRP